MGLVDLLPLVHTSFGSGTLLCGAVTVAVLQFFLPAAMYGFTPYYFQNICGCQGYFLLGDSFEEFLNNSGMYHAVTIALPIIGSVVFLIGIWLDRAKTATFFIYMMILFILEYVLFFCGIQFYFLSFSKVKSQCSSFPIWCYVSVLCVVIVYFYFIVIIKSYKEEVMVP